MTDPLDPNTVDATPVTDHFGFTRIGPNEGYDKNGWAFGDADRVKQDNVLWALANHEHTGEPALGDPTDAPALAALTTGGHLAPGTTYYYRISFLDKWMLETAASPEASITTPDPIDPPTAAASDVEVAGGTVTAGLYSYVITVLDAFGGETTPSDATTVTVDTGTTNRIALTLPDLPDGGIGFNIYRARPGQTSYYKLGSTNDTTYYDTGATEDQTITAPLNNTTNSSNAIQVSIASGVIPQGCVAWCIYRATASGDYQGDSLVHAVSEGATDTDPTPVTSWIDTGDVLLQGFPLQKSSTMPMPAVIDLSDIQGHLPITALPRGVQNIATAVAGALADGQLLNATEPPGDVRPTRFTALFKTPPAAGTSITLHATDTGGHTIDLVCSDATHQSGDPAGYYRAGWPVTDAGEYQAESGTRSDVATVDIVTDLAAVSGQAVSLDTQGEWVEIELGVLDAGNYTSTVTVRSVGIGNAVTGDLVIAAVRTDTQAVLASQPYDSGTGDTLYADKAGPSFAAPGGVPIALRVTKAGASTQTYNVDSMQVSPVVPVLTAGLITVTASVDSGAGAADVNAILWF